MHNAEDGDSKANTRCAERRKQEAALTLTSYIFKYSAYYSSKSRSRWKKWREKAAGGLRGDAQRDRGGKEEAGEEEEDRRKRKKSHSGRKRRWRRIKTDIRRREWEEVERGGEGARGVQVWVQADKKARHPPPPPSPPSSRCSSYSGRS